ncbi:MAG: ATPase, T2SS/T4P/T4SS family, partial [Candidatus Doudnabacteria bacterium]|nr:ATPase, T2SS/T4P/T4SS family [Candidatus Doudnabacteria bacterium]
KKILVDQKVIQAEDFEKLEKEAKDKKQTVANYLVFRKIIPEDRLAKLVSDFLDVPAIDLTSSEIPQDVLKVIPEPIARRHQVVAFKKKGNELDLAMTDPEDLQTREFVKKKTGFVIKPFLATKTSMDYALSQYHGNLKAEFENILTSKKEGKGGSVKTGETEGADLAKMAEEIPVVRVVDTLLEYSIFEGASDIHIEPQEKEVMVRYRIDGILHDAMTLPKVIQLAVVARIKVLSNLKIDEHRLPQDGRFKLQTDEYNISFRVSTIPIFDGEKVVLRLLDEGAKALTFEELGFARTSLEVIKRNLGRPHGMTLITGPTGSGKSTTLYTILTKLNVKGVNISTIEDPIEYRIPFINQMQVNPKIGLTFAVGLRALLRQDPNIIMIGEIRDLETSEEAIHAAMTGHIVLSTLHTNNAAGAIPRLLDMGVEPYLIASTLNTVIGQRLVRKICEHCKKSVLLSEKEAKSLSQDFDLENLLEVMKREQVLDKKLKHIEDVEFFEGEGCEKCGRTGYKGRMGIYETLDITENIAKLIMDRMTTAQIQGQGVNEGMVLMWQDGFIKAHTGLTTISEVLRVSKE